jgi:methionyl-tRNA formyltransferase
VSLPEGLWRDTQDLAASSKERRRLRLILLTADSSRILLQLHEEACSVVAVVTPEQYLPGRPQRIGLARRLLHAARQAFRPPTALESVAAELRVPVLRAWRLDEPGILRRLARLEPDVFVVAGYPEILSPKVLSLPRHGCLNVHASLLPRYRGPQPIAQALLHGEPYTGVTVHLMNERIDEGDILAQDVVPILPSDTVYTLAARIFELGGRLLLDVLERLALGRLERVRQDSTRATYFRRLGPDAGRIDWTQGALRIHNLMRLSPWLEVWTRLGRRKLVILGGRPEAAGDLRARQEWPSPEQRPGEILHRQGKQIVVLCGDVGRIVLEDWRLTGPWPLRAWASRKLRPGTVLDPSRASDPSGREGRERTPIQRRPTRPPARTSRTPRSSSSA